MSKTYVVPAFPNLAMKGEVMHDTCGPEESLGIHTGAGSASWLTGAPGSTGNMCQVTVSYFNCAVLFFIP